MTTHKLSSEKVQTGIAAAALVAGGVGTFVIGLLTTLSEASEGIANLLKWVGPVGPLSGKTGLGVIAWIISWFVLNKKWQGQEYDIKKAYTITLVLIGLGFLLTFPPFFVMFAAE